MSNSVRNKNPPWSLGSIKQIYVSEGRDFAQKVIPNLVILGGTVGATHDRPIKKKH